MIPVFLPHLKTWRLFTLCLELNPEPHIKQCSPIIEEIIDSSSSENPNYFNTLCEHSVELINSKLNSDQTNTIYKFKNPFPVMIQDEHGRWVYPPGVHYGNKGKVESKPIDIS